MIETTKICVRCNSNPALDPRFAICDKCQTATWREEASFESDWRDYAERARKEDEKRI